MKHLSPNPLPQLVEVSEMEEYPFEASDRLLAHHFTMFWHDRWLNSEMHLTASLDVQACALNLFFLAQKQSPIGTLPDDDTILAKLLRVDLATWLDLRRREINPLRNWCLCRCGDQVRLMHPVVTDILKDAMNRREAREASTAQRAVNERIRRLREAMSAMGCGKDVLGDDVLVQRIDSWMLDHCRGRRTKTLYDRALRHAMDQKWFGNMG